MAGANFNRLQKIYREDVVNKIKREKGDNFRTYALDLLTASTHESYNAEKSKMEYFIKKNECTDING